MPNEINLDRRRILRAAAMSIAAAQLGIVGSAAAQFAIDSESPSLAGGSAWLNSQPLQMRELRGKVVLVNFWTYTCINSLRVLPYVRAWAEKNIDNIRWAINAMKIDYPVAVDNDHAVWRAFNNEVWPALYFVDARGRIRHHQFGEGDYEQSERTIQQLLVEAGAGEISHRLVSIDAQGAEAPADWGSLKSPETYAGFELTENFSSPGGARLNNSHVYGYPAKLGLNHWALQSDWTVGREAAALNTANGRIAYRFHARDLHLVMGPAVRGTSVPFRVLIDGHLPGASHGSDIDDQGNGKVTEQRLYQLIRQPEPVADHLFEVEFLGSGVEAFDFTFG